MPEIATLAGVDRLRPPAFLAAREVPHERLVGPLPAKPGRLPTVLGELHLYRLDRVGSGGGETP
jgi:hypothetical protein